MERPASASAPNITAEHTPGALKRFHRNPGKFQQTFETPLKNVNLFVSAIFSAEPRISNGRVVLDKIVFDPTHLKEFVAQDSLSGTFAQDWSFTAPGTSEAQELLRAALSDWVDFLFIPTPKPFVIYADHDEYTAFFANTKSGLNKVTEALAKHGFKRVNGYERKT